jgi:hypothetical protein
MLLQDNIRGIGAKRNDDQPTVVPSDTLFSGALKIINDGGSE